MREAEALRTELADWHDVQRRADDLVELGELAADDPGMAAGVEAEHAALTSDFDRLRTALLFSGEYDTRPAILSISAGAGGTEATDWAEMLLRMYLRWAERHRFKTEILEATEGEGAGLKSVSFSIDGRWVYGQLRSERGVHRLVRISPFDSQKRRHTTFALVEVMPEVPEDAAVEIDDKDLRIDTYRASGAGGQHVNKTDSAVRITHVPSGIVVQCQNERSQTSNKQTALRILKSRLVELQEEEREAELAKERGAAQDIGFGSQIRSYVLHPYQLVKDHRTDFEVGNTQGVLDGNLDGFVHAYLLAKATGRVV